jgi:Tol biopolymer transport system component
MANGKWQMADGKWQRRPQMRHAVISCAALILILFAGLGAQTEPRYQVLFNRFLVPVMTLHIADADGKRERALLAASALDYSPSFSVDGQWVVFTSERDGQAEIYRVHPEGSGLERLTDHPAFDDQAALSPDGKTLAFVSTREGGTANIWLLDLASKKATNLTASRSGNFRPSWSPDGAWIAFTSDRDAQPGFYTGMWEHLQSTGIYVIKAGGGELRRLTRKDGFSGSPSWSADGRRILFYETDELGAYLAKSANSRTEIVSVDVVTGERKFYTASNETKLSPRWLSQGRISYIERGADATSGLRILRADRGIEPVLPLICT